MCCRLFSLPITPSGCAVKLAKHELCEMMYKQVIRELSKRGVNNIMIKDIHVKDLNNLEHLKRGDRRKIEKRLKKILKKKINKLFRQHRKEIKAHITNAWNCRHDEEERNKEFRAIRKVIQDGVITEMEEALRDGDTGGGCI